MDGVAERPDAFIASRDHAMQENLGDAIRTNGGVILGRRTYDDWSRFWPSSDMRPFAPFFNAVRKYVATS